MIKKLKAFTLQMMAGANVATIIIMLLVGFSDRLNPVTSPVLANVGLVFPVFLVINFGFLVFWIIFKIRGAIIPLLGFVAAYSPVRTYCPVNIGQEPPPDAIKVLSYNVWLFAGWNDGPDAQNPILEYIKAQDADIVCLQESNTSEVGQQRVDSVLNPIYQYRDTARHRTGDCISIYSRFPILSKEHINYASENNISAAFKLMIDGTEVLVINNHLESTGLSASDKAHFQNLVDGNMQTDTAKAASRLLIHKLAAATRRRAPQAEAVSRYIAYHRDMPVIVCGDFNDGPVSYTRRTIARNLIDCYRETATGPGISYHHNSFYVRIDNIMCSTDFEPYACTVDNKIKDSDHYPIVCWLKKRAKSAKNE